MKKFFSILVLICIGILIGINVKMMCSIKDIQTGVNEKNDFLQSQIDDLKKENKESKFTKVDKEDSEEENNNNSKKDEKEIEDIPIGEISKDKFKVCAKSSNIVYEKDDIVTAECYFFDVKTKEGKAFISYDQNNSIIESFFENQKNKSVETKELVGFSAKPVEAYIGIFGQDVLGQKILFTMDDGTIEYIDIIDIFENKNYKIKGKIDGLKNIKKFETVAIHDKTGGGGMTTIAIDEDGYYYDINEML